MEDAPCILVVDDEPSIRFVLEKALGKAGFQVALAASAEEARQLLRDERFAVVLLDVRLPGDSGFRLLEELRKAPTSPRVVVITAEDTLRAGVTAMGLGADEYLTKPFDLARLVTVVRELSRRGPVAARTRGAAQPAGLVGVSAAMVELSKQIGRAAASSLTVLITGESGTGKELVARAIHENSPRADGAFVTVNAAAIPRELVESELYGHEKGAFTSATARHEGRFEQADGGTLFMDEIGELPLDAQAKLLRAIQERTIDRVGGGPARPVDVRLVAATNADLHRMVDAGEFRADLYWRLSVLVLRVPPLRERPEDLVPLAAHFLARHGPSLAGRRVELAPDAEGALRAHTWPGNVRELENAIQRALVSCDGELLGADELARAIRAGPSPSPSPSPERSVYAGSTEGIAEGRIYAEVLERAERRILELALSRSGGNQVQAARWLGIHRNTLRARLQALGLSPTDG